MKESSLCSCITRIVPNLDPVLARIILSFGFVVLGTFLGSIVFESRLKLLAVGHDAAVVFATRLFLVRNVKDGLRLLLPDRKAFRICFWEES